MNPFLVLLAEDNSGKDHRHIPWNHSKSTRPSLPIDKFEEHDGIPTPVLVREPTRYFGSDGFSAKNASVITRNDSLNIDPLRTPVRDTFCDRKPHFQNSNTFDLSLASLSRTHIENHTQNLLFSPKQKLIDDNNQLSPVHFVETVSAPRNNISHFYQLFLNGNEMEFDPSDRDLPEKRVHESKTDAKATKLANTDDLRPVESTEMSTKPAQNEKDIDKTTAKANWDVHSRLLPLRNETFRTSSNVSTASGILDNIRKHKKLQPQEIHDQINASMRELEEASERENLGVLGDLDCSESDSSWSYFEESEGGSEDNKVLEGLDEYLPPRDFSGPSRGSSDHVDGHIEGNELCAGLPKSFITEPESLPPDGPSSMSRPKRSRLLHTGKLLGKYSGKLVRDKHQKTPITVTKKKYTDWLQTQWEKLQRLVDLDVPNAIIANSFLVMKELNCENKQELAQRVKFLVKAKR